METDQKIKLLILIPNLECGGSENYVSILCNHINTNKFDVTLAVLNNDTPFYTIDNKAIEVVNLKIKRVRKSLFAINKLIRKKQPDIVFTTANHLNLYLAIYRWIFPQKIKMIARESSIVSINSDRTKFPKIYKWLIKKFYNSFYGIICQSEYMQQDLTLNFKIPPGKTTVIHNPVDEHRGHYLALPGNNPSTKIYKFITVARLSEEKGIDRLIPAVAGLSLPFQYYIIGDGDRRNSLWELIHQFNLQDRVIMVGQKNNPYEGMEDADLMLMGSHYEGFPNVLLEAGALGIPVIAFDVPGGIREIITNGENGILVNDDDIKAFTAAIEKAMLIKFDSYKIIATTKKRFSTAATVIKTEELFLRLHHQPQ